MHDSRPHPLLAQVPLTVSPFVSLPTAPTLPYTYKSLPSTLPPSSTGISNGNGTDKPKYVVSSTGHAAHPDEIIASCRALQAHLQQLQEEAEKTLREWDEGIKARELAEKRRVAPGWLDSDAKLLEPERKGTATAGSEAAGAPNGVRAEAKAGEDTEMTAPDAAPGAETSTSEGEELDRAFGGLGLR